LKGILEKKSELIYLSDEDGGTPLHYAAYIARLWQGMPYIIRKFNREIRSSLFGTRQEWQSYHPPFFRDGSFGS